MVLLLIWGQVVVVSLAVMGGFGITSLLIWVFLYMVVPLGNGVGLCVSGEDVVIRGSLL